MRDTSSALPSVGIARQEPFGRVVPFLKAALLLGVGASFLQAIVLTLAIVFSLSFTAWWLALSQAYDHLQLYGWATLFVVGVVFHFLPRLRSVPLQFPRLIPWIVGVQAVALLLRLLSQPLLVMTGSVIWRVLLVLSGTLECVAFAGATLLFVFITLRRPEQDMRSIQIEQKKHAGTFTLIRTLYAGGPRRSIELGLGGAFASLALAALLNLGNVVQAALGNGTVQGSGDTLNIILGLFGFLVPVALMLSVHSLPTYADREELPQQIFWPLSTLYFIGLTLTFIGTSWESYFSWAGIVTGCGMLLLALVLLAFITVFLRLLRLQWQLLRPQVLQSPAPDFYQIKVAGERATYRPFILLVTSSYLWAALGSFLIIGNVVSLFGVESFASFASLDTIRYSFASGFIALLFASISVRLLPGFSGRKSAGPAWVIALFWLGNVAALLRVGPLLLWPILLAQWGGSTGIMIYIVLTDLSVPATLLFMLCLVINLWPSLRTMH